MTVREYIGARYVPLFMGEWDSTATYEPLSVVTNQGNSYTSRQYVPIGIPLTNETYWALTGNFNAQLQNYIEQVNEFSERIEDVEDDVSTINGKFPISGADIADDAITADKIADDAITSDKIPDGSITSNKIADDAITTDKIADDAITTDKIADDAITVDKIPDGSITSDKIADGSITPDKTSDDFISHKIIPAKIESMSVEWRKPFKRPFQGLNGGCRFVRNGTVYYAYALTVGTNNATIFVTDSNGNVLLQKQANNIGHAQNMTYLDGKLYITNTNYPQTESSGTGFTVYTITDSELVFDSIVTVPGNDVLFDATLDENYYYTRNGDVIQKINRNSGIVEASISFANLGIDLLGNGVSIWPKMNALVLNRNTPNLLSNQLYLLSLDDLQPMGVINVAQSYGYVLMFEPEWVSFDGYTVYIGNFSNFTTPTANTNDEAIISIMSCDVYNQKGLSCDGGVGVNFQVDSQLRNLTLDYENGTLYPSELNNRIKYTQDINGLMTTHAKHISGWNVNVSSFSPQMLILGNCNAEINIASNAAVAGLKMTSGFYAVSATGTNSVNSYVSNWARLPWALAMDSQVYFNVNFTGLDSSTQKLLSAYRSFVAVTTESLKPYIAGGGNFITATNG